MVAFHFSIDISFQLVDKIVWNLFELAFVLSQQINVVSFSDLWVLLILNMLSELQVVVFGMDSGCNELLVAACEGHQLFL